MPAIGRSGRAGAPVAPVPAGTAFESAAGAMIQPETARRVLAEALASGGDFAEIFAEDRTTTGVGLDDRRVEELATGHSRGAGIRVVAAETTGYAHTTDLSEPGLVAAARTAAAVAREGRSRTVPALASAGAGDPHPVAIAPATVPKQRKVDLLLEADDAARASGSAIHQVSASYGDTTRTIFVANSDGLLTSDRQVRTRFAVTCVANGDTGMQTGYESIAETVGFELFGPRTPREVAAEAARRALVKLDARPAPSGVVPIVLKGGSGGILFHEACGHGLEADHIAKGASVYTGKLGQTVASPLVTLVDDGTVGTGWGTGAIDDEGNAARRNILIEDGVLVDYMWDRVRADRDGRTTSGNGRRQGYQHSPMVRMTNTFLVAGGDDPAEIVAQTPHGVYVAKLGGGQVNTATGDFVFGTVEAYLIENGRITSPLRDMNLIGNGPEVLRRIDALANDFATTPGTCSKDGQQVPVGCGQPTLRIQGVTLGGTAR